jgi:hypothetical protein
MPVRGWFADRGLGHERFGPILLLVLVGFLVSGFDGQVVARITTAAINALVLVMVFRETGIARSSSRLVTLVFVGSLPLVMLSLVDHEQAPGGVIWMFQAAIAIAIAVAITARILRHRRVGLQTVFGAVCIYVMVGMAFAFIYGGLQTVMGSEVLQVNDGGAVDPLYYSIVTLTTLGFGDITSPEVLVRRITMIEAMFGQLFLAIMVARLVSLFGMERDIADPS